MNTFLRIFEQRVRGVRLIELIGFALALSMVFWVCLSKAREGDDIKHLNDLNDKIADQQAAVDQLRIKVATLERPSRLEGLAKAYLGMKPVAPNQEADLDSLSEISKATPRAILASQPQALPAPQAQPQPAGQDGLITTDARAPVTTPAPVAVTMKNGGAKP